MNLEPPPRDVALRFVLLLGVVSLLADVTYEGARSITGPFLAMLGASGALVGIVSGLGELTGNGLRLFSGWLADRTRRYWFLTLAGYTINLLAVPLLALAGRWEIAAALIIAERTGKALRTPPRDAILSHATARVGRGWGFGLHEAMDQIGAVAGPLLVAAVLRIEHNYRLAFALLLAPALAALGVLLRARQQYPNPQDLEPSTGLAARGFSRAFWMYMAAVGLVAAGYVDFPLIAYHLGRHSAFPAEQIPLLYALAMGVDALAALIFGRLFDKLGISLLALVAAVSALAAPLAFSGGRLAALIAMAVWGAGVGAQESVLRAAVGALAPASRRGTAYGLFNAFYGLLWFTGSAIMGVLYDISLKSLIMFSVAAQLLAVPLFLAAVHAGKSPRPRSAAR